jgi:hypothetical protein
MLAEVGEGEVDGPSCRARDDYLTPVRRGGNSGRNVDVFSDVALRRHERSPGVETHTYSDRAGRKRFCQLLRRGKGTRRGREGEEEGVSLRVHLDSVAAGTGRSDQATVLRKRLSVTLGPELAQQACRALDIGEEERDRSGWEIPGHGEIIAELATRGI